jgi:phosphoribosylaminoimidazole-succinocarboxamide synthase
MVVKHSELVNGATKTLFSSVDGDKAILSFTDNKRHSNARQGGLISGKGIINNRISAHLMTCLESIGLPTHFLKSVNMREQQVRRLEAMEIVFRVRNVAAGGLSKRIGLEEGTILPRPIIEFYRKRGTGDYSLVTDDHIMAFQWAEAMELEEIVTIAYRANDYLNGLMTGLGIRLVDFQMEIGRLYGEYGELYLMIMDELSPDSMRLWDIKTNKPFSGDIESYQEVAARLGVIPRERFNEKKAQNWDNIENILANDTTRKIRPIMKKGTKGRP